MLRYLAGLAIVLCAPFAVAASSFDCKTAESARELSVCRDKRLAAASRALDQAYHAASTHSVSATREALKYDQEEFLNALDSGFPASIWGKTEPSSEQMRKDIWALKRGGKNDPLADLEAQLKKRVLFLRSLSAPDGFAGLWKNFDTELLILPESDHFLVTYGTSPTAAGPNTTVTIRQNLSLMDRCSGPNAPITLTLGATRKWRAILSSGKRGICWNLNTAVKAPSLFASVTQHLQPRCSIQS